MKMSQEIINITNNSNETKTFSNGAYAIGI
jgi:hypothetical protein